MRFEDLLPLATKAGARLKARGETIAVSESSTGGLISAALLSVPGASSYFLGGAVVYTRVARNQLVQIGDEDMTGMRPASEPYAQLLAARSRTRFEATWGLAETGATGPTGNRYGDAAGHSCIAIAGPIERVITLETGRTLRHTNMCMFAQRALEVLIEALE
ncbi:MAG: nicotinamide-nucleotide amidohydrolase family protein [Burkholderiaceae bacterium]|nr:nicotinamide-nucleotide amidohydrolase family protein [Burkholderiaceae bacterium]